MYMFLYTICCTKWNLKEYQLLLTVTIFNEYFTMIL